MRALSSVSTRLTDESLHTGVVLGLAWWATTSVLVTLCAALVEGVVRHALAAGETKDTDSAPSAKRESEDRDAGGDGWLPPPDVPW